jgi:hypothetical protein
VAGEATILVATHFFSRFGDTRRGDLRAGDFLFGDFLFGETPALAL